LFLNVGNDVSRGENGSHVLKSGSPASTGKTLIFFLTVCTEDLVNLTAVGNLDSRRSRSDFVYSDKKPDGAAFSDDRSS
jgi:hypothetical protein